MGQYCCYRFDVIVCILFPFPKQEIDSLKHKVMASGRYYAPKQATQT